MSDDGSEAKVQHDSSVDQNEGEVGGAESSKDVFILAVGQKDDCDS